jgi:ribulose bisphosphate carboxylase small subunit
MFTRKEKANANENFTHEEMRKYPEALRINCSRSKDMLHKLRSMNKKNCNFKGRTARDTINNKTVCYDDIAKEIVTGLDAESNCVMSEIINGRHKSKKSKSKSSSKKDKIIPINPKKYLNIKPMEGPDFINTFFVPGYDTKRIDGYASFIVNKPVGSVNKHSATAPYDDVSRISSDPAFLGMMTKYEENKPVDGLEYKSNIMGHQ